MPNKAMEAARQQLPALTQDAPRLAESSSLRVASMGTGAILRCADALAGVRQRAWTCERLRPLMRHDARLTISLLDFAAEPQDVRGALGELKAMCELIAGVMSDTGYERRDLGLCLHSHAVPAGVYAQVSEAYLGSGPRHLLFDNRQMSAANESHGHWRSLWRIRDSCVQPAYSGVVRSACSLLPDEAASAVLPDIGAIVPQHTAWVSIQLPLMGFLRNETRIDWISLRHAIAKAVALADEHFDNTTWSCSEQLADATHNRRLAVLVSGIGKIVERSGRDPRQLETLNWINRVIERVRMELHTASRTSARCNGPLPALSCQDPSTGLRAGSTRENWRRRWQAAVQQAPLRHRNLLLLSPQDVLPEGVESRSGFEDLLPVLRHADAWCFPQRGKFACLELREYVAFHRRAWAVIRSCSEGCVVAARGSVI